MSDRQRAAASPNRCLATEFCCCWCLFCAGGSRRSVCSAPERRPGPVCRREASEGWQQVHLPQPGGRGVPPAGVLLAGLRLLQAASHFQGTTTTAVSPAGLEVSILPVIWGCLQFITLFTPIFFLLLVSLASVSSSLCKEGRMPGAGKHSCAVIDLWMSAWSSCRHFHYFDLSWARIIKPIFFKNY